MDQLLVSCFQDFLFLLFQRFYFISSMMDVNFVMFLLILVQWTMVMGVEIEQNNPVHCRCGEAIQGKIEMPHDIQVFSITFVRVILL